MRPAPGGPREYRQRDARRGRFPPRSPWPAPFRAPRGAVPATPGRCHRRSPGAALPRSRPVPAATVGALHPNPPLAVPTRRAQLTSPVPAPSREGPEPPSPMPARCPRSPPDQSRPQTHLEKTRLPAGSPPHPAHRRSPDCRRPHQVGRTRSTAPPLRLARSPTLQGCRYPTHRHPHRAWHPTQRHHRHHRHPTQRHLANHPHLVNHPQVLMAYRVPDPGRTRDPNRTQSPRPCRVRNHSRSPVGSPRSESQHRPRRQKLLWLLRLLRLLPVLRPLPHRLRQLRPSSTPRTHSTPSPVPQEPPTAGPPMCVRSGPLRRPRRARQGQSQIRARWNPGLLRHRQTQRKPPRWQRLAHPVHSPRPRLLRFAEHAKLQTSQQSQRNPLRRRPANQQRRKGRSCRHRQAILIRRR